MAEGDRLLDLGFTPGRLPEGTHVCFFFSDEVERRSVIHPYVRAGLKNDEEVHYFADALGAELSERALDEQTTASLTRAEAGARVRVLPTRTFSVDSSSSN